MELLKIKVSNFKIFREMEIDLKDQELLIIRGDNGSGKSSLICESLLYALYGKCESTNITGRYVDDLIRIRAKDMQVYVEFNYKGQNFEILRKRRLSGSPKASYEIKVDGVNQGKKTFDEITGLDYKTFLNTILISQGQMTKFLDLKPAERKKLITDFFDLQKYNDYAALAKNNHGMLTSSINNLEERNIILVDKIKDPKIIENELKTVMTDFNKESSVMRELKKNLSDIRVKLDDIHKRDKEKRELETKKSENDKSLLIIKEEKEKIKKKIMELDEKIKDIDNLKKLKIELDKNKTNKNSLTDKHEEFKELKHAKEKIETEIKNKTESLKKEISRDERELKDYIKREEELKNQINEAKILIKKLPALNKKKEGLEKIKAEITKEEVKEKKFIELTNNIKNFENIISLQEKQLKTEITNIEKELLEINKLKEEKEGLEKKVDLLKLLVTDFQKNKELQNKLEDTKEKLNNRITILRTEKDNLEDYKKKEEDEFKPILEIGIGAKCPQCKQELNSMHLEKLKTEFKEKITNLDKKISIKVKEFKHNASKTALIKKELLELKLKIKEQQEGSNKLEVIKSKLETNTKAIYEKKKLESKILDLKSNLKNKNFALDAFTNINKAKTQLTNLSFDKRVLSQFKEEFRSYTNVISEISRIDEINKNKEKMINELKKQEQLINELKKKTEDDIEILQTEKHIQQNKKELKDISKKRETLKEFEDKYQTAKKKILDLEKQEIEKRYTEAQSAKNEINIRKEREIAVEREILVINNQIDKYTKLLEPYSNVIEKMESIKKQDSKVEKNVDKQNTILTNLKVKKVKLENDQKQNDDDIKERIKLEKKKETLFTEARITINLQNAFKEIVEQIFDRIKKDISYKSSYLLRRLSNGNLPEITFEEGFAMKIPYLNEDRHIEFFSGGQKTRIAMAFRVAVSQIIAQITDTSLDTLIIDEGDFGSLDRDGRDAIGEILPKLVDSGFKKVIVITHINEIAENFPENTFNL